MFWSYTKIAELFSTLDCVSCHSTFISISGSLVYRLSIFHWMPSDSASPKQGYCVQGSTTFPHFQVFPYRSVSGPRTSGWHKFDSIDGATTPPHENTIKELCVAQQLSNWPVLLQWFHRGRSSRWKKLGNGSCYRFHKESLLMWPHPFTKPAAVCSASYIVQFSLVFFKWLCHSHGKFKNARLSFHDPVRTGMTLMRKGPPFIVLTSHFVLHLLFVSPCP